jgi:hypothetical protein
MTDHLIKTRFFAVLHFARICKEPKQVRHDLLRIAQYIFTVGYSAGLEVNK